MTMKMKMTKQDIINQVDETYIDLLFSDPIVNTNKSVQRAIELTEPAFNTIRETECAVTFENAVRLFNKRVELAYDVIKIYSNLQA